MSGELFVETSRTVWLGRPVMTPENLSAVCTGSRGIDAQVVFQVGHEKPSALAALIHLARGSDVGATNCCLSVVGCHVPCGHVGHNLVKRVEHAEPVLVSDKVCLVGQVVSLVADSFSAFAMHFHDSDVQRPNENKMSSGHWRRALLSFHNSSFSHVLRRSASLSATGRTRRGELAKTPVRESIRSPDSLPFGELRAEPVETASHGQTHNLAVVVTASCSIGAAGYPIVMHSYRYW
jgi:hypothetical protein